MNILGIVAWKARFLTTIDDWIRLGTMTIIAIIAGNLLDLSGLAFTLLLAIGVAIDVHDIWVKAVQEKPIV